MTFCTIHTKHGAQTVNIFYILLQSLQRDAYSFCVREATVPMNHCIYLQDLMLWGRHRSMNEKKNGE